jgi:hypothetical protein
VANDESGAAANSAAPDGYVARGGVHDSAVCAGVDRLIEQHELANDLATMAVSQRSTATLTPSRGARIVSGASASSVEDGYVPRQFFPTEALAEREPSSFSTSAAAKASAMTAAASSPPPPGPASADVPAAPPVADASTEAFFAAEPPSTLRRIVVEGEGEIVVRVEPDLDLGGGLRGVR